MESEEEGRYPNKGTSDPKCDIDIINRKNILDKSRDQGNLSK